MDAGSERYVAQVAEQSRSVLGPHLVGVYLHGSAVLGGYDARRSDLDVLVVVDRSCSGSEKSELELVLYHERVPCPARGLELSVVTSDVAARPTNAPPFELHITTAPEDRKTVDGATAAGDPDLVLHFAVCRAAGRGIGPSRVPADVFAAVPRGLVLSQLADELGWALSHACDEYAVLNACRAWKYAYDDSLVSKLAGGEWALGHLQSPAHAVLVTTALARQRSLTTQRLDPGDLTTFVADVSVQLRRAAA